VAHARASGRRAFARRRRRPDHLSAWRVRRSLRRSRQSELGTRRRNELADPYWHTDAAMATMALLLLIEESGWQAALWATSDTSKIFFVGHASRTKISSHGVDRQGRRQRRRLRLARARRPESRIARARRRALVARLLGDGFKNSMIVRAEGGRALGGVARFASLRPGPAMSRCAHGRPSVKRWRSGRRDHRAIARLPDVLHVGDVGLEGRP